MKRIALAVILISIIVIPGVIWLFSGQNEDEYKDANRIEDKTYDVKFVDFKWTSSWAPGPVGLLWGKSFNVTLRNMEDREVEGLSVEVKLLANNTEITAEFGIYGLGKIGSTEHNVYDGRLNASEIRELRGYFMTSLDELDRAQDWGEKIFTARVLINDTILDELTLPYT